MVHLRTAAADEHRGPGVVLPRLKAHNTLGNLANLTEIAVTAFHILCKSVHVVQDVIELTGFAHGVQVARGEIAVLELALRVH